MQDFTTIIKHGSTWATYKVILHNDSNYQATLIGYKGEEQSSLPGRLTIEKMNLKNVAAGSESSIENKLAQAIQYTELDGPDLFS